MFQHNARIENLQGIRFYEQDMLYDDHTYTGDIKIVVQADYVSPGFGIALMNNEGVALHEQKEIYLFKVGYRESSVIYKQNLLQKQIKKTATVLEPPHNKLTFTFTKQGKHIKLVCSAEKQALIEYTLPNDNWDKYSIGFYSNAGNVIRNINIASSIPKNWIVNMHNTDGGYVKFFKSGFEFIGCRNNAEIEQTSVNLKAGIYFLKYETDAIKPCDVKPYIFLEGDEAFYSDEKSILKDGCFKLEKDSRINLRFSGKNGVIKNINICEKPETQYVPTKDDNSKIEGSYITIELDNIEYFTWTGKITGVPDNVNEHDPNEIPFVISNEEEKFNCEDLKIALNKFYTYTYFVDNLKFATEETDNPKNTAEYEFYKKAAMLTLFKNMDAVVTAFKVKQKGKDELIDLIQDNVNKKYVTCDITSPIVVVDNENMPLDLSSSYRVLKTLDKNNKLIDIKYLFTNCEREIFEPNTYIKLDKLPSREPNKVKIYGIPKGAQTNMDDFYSITKEGADNLFMYTKSYDTLTSHHITHINLNTGEVYLENIEKYESIVIDYEKRLSYCINYRPEISMYEILISNEQQDAYLVYDEPIMRDGILEAEGHKLLTTADLPMKPINKSYIVLRKEWNL